MSDHRFIICPNCAATVPAPVRVESVRVDGVRLLVAYAQEWVDHVCPEDAP